ncbi:MAG TPA: DNA repair exonuclease [Firmicutes bacterium]|nr:DNA repair exonuclease [Bacillota bacterium]
MALEMAASFIRRRFFDKKSNGSRLRLLACRILPVSGQMARPRSPESGGIKMAPMRVLHLADLHLGWSPSFMGNLQEERQRVRDSLLKRAVDYALSEKGAIQMVIIAGDLFETHRPDPVLEEAVIKDLRRLTDKGITVVTVPGNHDEISYHDSVYRRRASDWPGILVHNPQPDCVAQLQINNTPCYLYSLAYTGGLTKPIMDASCLPKAGATPGVHIGVFHGSLDWDAGDRSLPLASDALAAAGYDFVALGHIHKYQEKKKEQTHFLYPGAIEAKSFSDPGTGFFSIININVDAAGGMAAAATAGAGAGASAGVSAGASAGTITVEKVPVPDVRRCLQDTLDLSGLSGEDEVLSRIKALAERSEADRASIRQIRLTGVPVFVVDSERLRSLAADSFYFLDVTDETAYLAPELLESYAKEQTVRGFFVRRMMTALNEAADDHNRKVISMAMLKGIAALTGTGGAQ